MQGVRIDRETGRRNCRPGLNYAKFISPEEVAISFSASLANRLLFRATLQLSDDFSMLFFFFNQTLHRLPSWSKRSVIAVKKAPYGGEGKARSMPVAMFKTAAANTLCKCMNLFQRARRGTGGEGEMRRTHSEPWLVWTASCESPKCGERSGVYFQLFFKSRYRDRAKGADGTNASTRLHAHYRAMSSKTNIIRLRYAVC